MPMIVMQHALSLKRPILDHVVGLRMEPGTTVWHPKKKSKVYGKGLFSHITAIGDFPGDVIAVQVTYAAWWAALDAIRRAVQSHCLTLYKVTDEMPSSPQKESERMWAASIKFGHITAEDRRLYAAPPLGTS